MKMKKITKLTAAQERLLIEFREEWRGYGLCCDPADFATGDEIIRGFYRRLNKPDPMILHFSSPAMCELAVNFIFAILAEKKPAQLYSQLYSQLRSQLDSQLYSQLYSQLRSQLRSQLDSQLGGLKSFFLNNRWGAQHWCSWEAFYLFGHEIGVTYNASDIALLQEWGRLSKSVGWWAPWDGICFVSDRPRVVKFDDQLRLHNENGKAVEYSDGWGVSAWHGTRVPDEWLENRDNIDPTEVLRTSDVEQRAAGAAIIGWPKMARILDRRIIDGDPETDIGALIELSLPGLSEPGRFLQAICPRNGTIVEGVPRVSDIDNLPIETAMAAQAWRDGLPASEYQHPLYRT
jgi:hypothetical protein